MISVTLQLWPAIGRKPACLCRARCSSSAAHSQCISRGGHYMIICRGLYRLAGEFPCIVHLALLCFFMAFGARPALPWSSTLIRHSRPHSKPNTSQKTRERKQIKNKCLWHSERKYAFIRDFSGSGKKADKPSDLPKYV